MNKIKKFNSFLNDKIIKENNEMSLSSPDLSKYVEQKADITFTNGGNGQNLLDCGLYEVAAHIEAYLKGTNPSPGEEGFYTEKTIKAFKALVDAISQDEVDNNNINTENDDYDDFVKLINNPNN